MATFIATVIIIVILLVFVFGSGILKKVTGADGGEIVESEKEVGLDDVFYYLPNYLKLMKVNVLMRKGQSFEDASLEVEYVE